MSASSIFVFAMAPSGEASGPVSSRAAFEINGARDIEGSGSKARRSHEGCWSGTSRPQWLCRARREVEYHHGRRPKSIVQKLRAHRLAEVLSEKVVGKDEDQATAKGSPQGLPSAPLPTNIQSQQSTHSTKQRQEKKRAISPAHSPPKHRQNSSNDSHQPPGPKACTRVPHHAAKDIGRPNIGHNRINGSESSKNDVPPPSRPESSHLRVASRAC